MQKKIALMLHYKCNNNCRFCYCADKNNIEGLTTEEAKEKLRSGKERGCNFVDFNGGEPTLRRDLITLIKYAKKLGYDTIAMTTNGRMLSYKKFSKKLIDAGLNNFIVSIHGHNSSLHDFLTRVKGSFKQVSEGIKNIKEIDQDIYICTNTTITKYNYKYLPEIAKNNMKLGVDACEFIFVHPKGNALKNFEEIVPTLNELKPFISPTIDVGEKEKMSHFAFRYVPLCYVPKENLSEFVFREKIKEQHVGPEFEDLVVEKGRKEVGRIKAEKCKKCKYFNICEGIWREYAKRRGLGELKPVID